VTVMENLCDLLLQYHINNNDGKQQQNLIPGNGSYDFSHFIGVLNRYGYDGFLSV